MTYRLENVGEAEVGYAWSAHPLFSVDAGDLIVLPSSVDWVRVEDRRMSGLGQREHSIAGQLRRGGAAKRLIFQRLGM